MSENSSNSKRIAKNSIILYIRMTILMVVNLYTVRVVVNVLGLEDYGIYNVVAGVVTMLNCVSIVLSTATQRFYSYAQGENQIKKQKDVFAASLVIFAVVSLLVIILGETVGLWFTNAKLVIPADRLISANWIYQFALFTFITTLLQIPYSAAVIAHEDMGIYSVITTLEYLLKLGFALLIPYIPIDRLINYGATLFVAQFLLFVYYVYYGRRHYKECHYEKCEDKSLYKQILGFSGWTLFGQVASVGMNQGNTILVNLFFGPIINAARAISLQINSALNAFCNSFIMAIRPPMIRSYAEGNTQYLNQIFNLSNKFIYYSLFMLCMPLILEMDVVLKFWLDVDDATTILFSQLIVIYAVILNLNNPISIIVQATGKVRNYNVYVEIFTLLCPIITYIAFKMGAPAYSTFIIMIVCVCLSHVLRLIILQRLYRPFRIIEYMADFVFKALLISIICILICLYCRSFIDSGFIRLVIVTGISIVVTLLFALTLGLNVEERRMIRSFLKRK